MVPNWFLLERKEVLSWPLYGTRLSCELPRVEKDSSIYRPQNDSWWNHIRHKIAMKSVSFYVRFRLSKHS